MSTTSSNDRIAEMYREGDGCRRGRSAAKTERGSRSYRKRKAAARSARDHAGN